MVDGRERYDVVVVGDLFCDIATNPLRGYPEKDKQEGCDFMLSLGGQAGNCAAACGALGLKTAFICGCGDDPISNWLLSALRINGVECFPVKKGKKPGITVSIVFEDGSRSMLSDRGANMRLCSEDIDFSLLSRARFVMRAGHWNTECLFNVNRRILEKAKESGAFTGVDIGWSAYLGWTDEARRSVYDFLPFTDFLFVNEAELEALCNSASDRMNAKDSTENNTESNTENSTESGMHRRRKNVSKHRNDSKENERRARELVEYAREVIRVGGCKHVILHRGSEGSAWISEETAVFRNAFDVQVRNPTGAGDVFNAAFIFAFLSGNPPAECLNFANACAAVFLSMKTRDKYPRIEDVQRILKSAEER